MQAEIRQHIDRILTTVATPHMAAALPAAAIHRSWARCVNDHGLHPGQRGPWRVETDSRLRRCREQIEDDLQVARAGMEQLYKCVADLGYVLLLTDGDGVTIDFIGNDAWDRSLKQGGLHLGVNWKEAYAGTNGIGTCLVEQLPLICHHDDHFFYANHPLSCTTSPLFRPDGEFLGVLDVSAMDRPGARDSQHLAQQLTCMYARVIEDAIFMRHFRERWVMRMATASALAEVASELMLACDGDGRIVGANSGARRRLQARDPHSGAPLPSLIGRPLGEVFRGGMDQIWLAPQRAGAGERVLLSSHGHQAFHASLLPPRQLPASSLRPHAERAEPRPTAALERLSGDDPHMQRVQDQARRLLNKRVNILIQGETGTGKEVFARALHDCSERADQAFVAVNCAAIPESLIESELFGYTPGTFTGARAKGMKGLIQQAHGGTLFLDEIGDMALPLQTRLLRVLSEHEVLPLGADRPVRVDLTVVAASHRDLRRQIAAGSFREDLYYRLCGATLALPPLRERADKRYLIERLLAAEAARLQLRAWIHPQALARLERYAWPGNIRQLSNVIRYAVVMSDGQGVFVEHLPAEISPSLDATWLAESAAVPAAAETAPASAELRTLTAALRRHQWNVTAVADELGICRATVYRRMKRLDIVPPTHC